MVKLSKLYTRQGDDGGTGLIGGERVQKCDLQVEAYGNTDELNSWLGAVRAGLRQQLKTTGHSEKFQSIQQTLFDIGAELATPESSEWQPPTVVGEAEIQSLETDIDTWTSQVSELKSFLLPGGSRLTSDIHIARSVCRRTERSVVRLQEQLPVRTELISYLNRLSDWLFALARVVAQESGEEEILWETKRSK